MPTLLNISRFRALFISFLSIGLFFVLGTTSALAGDNYTVGGGDPTALPAVGATPGAGSGNLSNITLTDTGGDDFNTGAFEDIVIAINTAAYPSVVFDQSVNAAAITITGTCTASTITTTSATYTSATSLTIRATDNSGAPLCAAAQNIVIAGLKVGTTYTTAAPGAAALYTVDNSTTTAGAAVSGPSVNYAVATGALSSLSMTPDTYANSSLSTYTVAFTTTAVTGSTSIPNNGNIQITFPTGYDLTGMSGTASDLSGLTGTWTMSVSGQVLTLTQSGGSATTAGAKSLKIANVRNPASAGTSGAFTILTRTGVTSVQTGAPAAITIAVGTTSTAEFNDISNVSVTDYTDGGVLITWDDPTDDDTSYIQILKGTDPLPVNGTVYATVALGTEFYVDTDVEVGDVVTYQFRETDGSDTGTLSDEVTFTVGSSTTTDSDDTTDDTTDDTSDDTTDDTTDDTSDDSSDVEEDVEFSDVSSSHWAAAAIEVMVGAGVVEGYEDGTFGIDANLNRAEAATLLWRIVWVGEPYEVTADPFEDVEMSAWYAGYINDLLDEDLIEGNPDGTFEPSESINRAEFLQLAMNVYLYLYPDMEASADELMEGAATDMFADLDTAAWYEGVVTVAAEWGFVNGSACDEGTCFNASSSITRAEATQMLYNIFGDSL